MNAHRYDNLVGQDNVFGHTLELLSRHAAEDAAGAVHLDIACGFGRIAEPLVERFGVEYVGVDLDPEGLESLRGRGFEAHLTDLSGADAGEILTTVLDGRRLASISFLDGLEHLTDGSHVLQAVGALLAEHRGVAVFSVPNVTHVDVGIKALLGDWHYTDSGLLDATHFQLYSERSLTLAMRRAGLNRIDAYDVVLASSDQHFPLDHLGLAESTTINRWLRRTRRAADEHGITNQFVWAVTAVPPRAEVEIVRPEAEFFLSVVMRTQGRRSQELREALLCLAGQLNTDFEVLIVAHKTSVAEQIAIERVIEDQPPSLRHRIRLLVLDNGRRAAPLNLALREARGRYLGIFDDDDIVLGNWVDEFARAECTNRGRILRAVSLCQDVTHSEVRAIAGVRGLDSPKRVFTRRFSLTEHLALNQSPTLSWVFPRSLFLDFGLSFDESMTTTEDWEFLLRAAEIAGVTDIDRVVAIYQWWKDRETSKTLHSQEEWLANQREVERRIDAEPLLLPAGETRKLRKELLRLKELERIHKAQLKQISRSARRIAFLELKITRLRTKKERATRLARQERRRRLRLARELTDSRARPSRAFLARVRRKFRS